MINVGYGVSVLSRCLRNGGIDGIGSYTKELMYSFQDFDDVKITSVSFGEVIPQQILKQSNDSIRLSGFGAQAILSASTGVAFPDSKRLKSSTKIDLFHATDHRIPKLVGVPVIATLMDAIPLSNPEWINMKFAKLKFALWKKSAQWAEHVLTISEYSKQQIIEHFGLAEEKISVVPLGVDNRWFQSQENIFLDAIKTKYDLPDRYLLSVGTIQPRKNIERVVEAHQKLSAKVRQEVPLVIVGRHGWMCDELIKKLESGCYKDSVIWLRHLPDEELVAVVQMATALVFASLGEGFGLPVLEAFAAGTPVITSNTTSLPEVAGDAALLVNPIDVDEISHTMARIIEDNQLVINLQEEGRLRAKAYTWEKTASLTVQSYRKVLNQ